MKQAGRPPCGEYGLEPVPPMTTEQIALVAKALAHPARLRILKQFSGAMPHIATEIVGECDLAQSTVSEHLRILREAGVLIARRDGRRTWYCLRRSVLRSFALAVEDLTLVTELIDVG